MNQGLPPKVGPYEPIELLAEGGMARVVVARRTGLAGFERLVALKLILPELAADERYVTMFLDEARMASRVQHPNVVSVLEVGRDESTGILYMAMDLVLGATLSQFSRAHPAGIPAHAALEIVAQAADGLDAAHRAVAADGSLLALVHRDICPQNLLIGFDGFVRVSDFGIARAEQRNTRTETGKFKGKLGYCSPEHVMGQPVDHRSDIFALGIVAFELITGVKLFASTTPSKTLRRLIKGEVPSIATLSKDVPADAIAAIDAALSRSIEERPARASAFAEAIRAACVKAGFESPREAIQTGVANAATDQAVRLAGMPDRERPKTMSPPLEYERHTSLERPSRDTVVDTVMGPGLHGPDTIPDTE